MTDNEMIKCLQTKGCNNGSSLGHHSGKMDLIADRLLELITENNRQKAEIERLQLVQVNYAKAFLDEYADRLKDDFSFMFPCTDDINKVIDELTDTMKNEYSSYPNFTNLIVKKAIKEFADLVDKDIKEKLSDTIQEQNPHLYLIHQIVKDRLKEMVGED